METNIILQGDALSQLKTLPDESIDCVMTSPPYWALRDYGVEGQLGLEDNPQKYITSLCDIFDEVKRILKKEGTCWVNMGDTYGGSGDKGKWKDPKYPEGRNGQSIAKNKSQTSKCLCLVPSRFAIEMCNRGWILRNDIVWYKRNAMPSSVNDRLKNCWEHLFFFVKSKKYYFDLDSIRKPYSSVSLKRFQTPFTNNSSFNVKDRKTKIIKENAESLGEPRARYHRVNKQDSLPSKNITMYKGFNERWKKSQQREFDGRWGNDGKGMAMPSKWNNPKGGNPGDHWDITTKPHKFAHFAVYPEQLCEIPIKAGCHKDGVVLDPFGGSGTTGITALKQGKKFILIELNKEYIEIAKSRLKPLLQQSLLQINPDNIVQ